MYLLFTFTGNSVLRFHSDTDSVDGKFKLKSAKINLNLGDVEINIIKSKNPSMGKILFLN